MISVCIPTFNGAKYIREQLDSIIYQLSFDDEIIISDDSSTDNTIEIIEDMNDRRIRILKNNKFKNPIFNLENALSHSKGSIIFTADQDDVWLPGKVSAVVKQLDIYDIVVTDCKVVDENLNIVIPSFFQEQNSGKGLLRNLWKNSYLGCCLAFKSNVLKAVLPFPRQIPMHDIWIGAVADSIFRPLFLDTPLLLYRRHNANVSSASERSKNSLFEKLIFRINIIVPLIQRIIIKSTKGKQ